MMEKVELQPQKARLTTEEVAERYPWATTGCKGRKPNVITSVELRSEINGGQHQPPPSSQIS